MALLLPIQAQGHGFESAGPPAQRSKRIPGSLVQRPHSRQTRQQSTPKTALRPASNLGFLWTTPYPPMDKKNERGNFTQTTPLLPNHVQMNGIARDNVQE